MTPCPSGYYCLYETENYEDTPCPAGKYSMLQGNDQQSDCDDCPLGHYCLEATIMPIPCPKGTYRDTVGAKYLDDSGDSDACTICPGGSMCPWEGMTEAIDCGAGHYSPEGSHECFTC